MPSRSRIVLLTGAAGGIGRVMTRALLGDGHCVAAVDWDAASLERLKSLCNRTERLCPILADLSTETGCAHAIEIARERFGTIEALVNNAGIGMSAIRPDAEVSHPGIEELTPEIWDRFFAIFVRAPVILTRLTLPLMREARFGRIVNNTTSYCRDGRGKKCCGQKSWDRRSLGSFRMLRPTSTDSASPQRVGTPLCLRPRLRSVRAGLSVGPSWRRTQSGS